MTLYQHYDMVTESNRRLTRTGFVGCSHRSCRSFDGLVYNPAAEIVAEPYSSFQGSGVRLLAPCANHRRAMRMQMGRGSRDYVNLVFTGIMPTTDLDYAASATAIRNKLNADAEAVRRARLEAIERDRPGIIQSFLTPSTPPAVAVDVSREDAYGRRYISIPSYSYVRAMTPAHAERLAALLLESAREVRGLYATTEFTTAQVAQLISATET